MNPSIRIALPLIAAVALLAAACSDPEPTPQPPIPTIAIPTATATVAPTATPVPTSTPIPTATPVPPPTPTPTPEVSPTATPMLDALFVYTRAIRLYEVEEWDDSIAAFGQVIRRLPTFAQAYRGRGLGYQKKELTAFAMEDFDKAIELKPDYADAYKDRGVLFEELGQRDRAIADLRLALSLYNPVREFGQMVDARQRLEALTP